LCSVCAVSSINISSSSTKLLTHIMSCSCCLITFHVLWNWQQLKVFFQQVAFHEISVLKSHVLYQSYIKSL
jgi:hypothetical protein